RPRGCQCDESEADHCHRREQAHAMSDRPPRRHAQLPVNDGQEGHQEFTEDQWPLQNRRFQIRMTNDQIRRNPEIRMTKLPISLLNALRNSGFGFLSTFFIRPSSFSTRLDLVSE